MAYDIDFKEEAVIKDHIKKFLLYPKFWDDPSNNLTIPLKWKSQKFFASNLSKIPSQRGVYAFVLKPKFRNFLPTSYLFYVGKTNRTLKERYQEYLNEMTGKGKPRKKVHKMLNQYNGYLHFYYTEIKRQSTIDHAEDSIINAFVPHINVRIPKARIKKELLYIYEQN